MSNGKLRQLPYIKKDRLQTILHEQFGILKTNHTQDQLRDLARDIIRKNIKINNESIEKLTNNLTENLEIITNFKNINNQSSRRLDNISFILDKILDINNFDIRQANWTETTKLINNYITENETKPKIEFKTMIRQPHAFLEKMGEDVDPFIENFDLSTIINNWAETEKIKL